MAAQSRDAPFDGPWTKRARNLDEWLSDHRVVVSATSASFLSTFAGFPLDSLKSRLQSSRESISIARLAAEVVKEEGIGGLWRGFPLPLITISVVRTISFTIYTSTKRILNASSADPLVASPGPPKHNSIQLVDHEGPYDPLQTPGAGPSSRPWVDVRLNMFNGDTARDVAITSALAGGASGAVVCVGSAPFELVKVRRQLEYQIYRDSHPELFAPQPPPQPNTSVIPPHHSAPSHPAGTSASPPWHHSQPAHPAAPSARPPPFVPPTTMQAVRMIVRSAGWRGLYTGWSLHFIRDMSGTALYFAEYDVMRWMLGRKRFVSQGGRDGEEQGDVPDWAKGWLHKGLIPFVCGSLAGVTSWALIYPVDAIKTKAQQRALSGLSRRTPLTQLRRLVRGTDANNPKPWLTGIARLYRGLGVSMIRSMLTHGLLWTIVDAAGSWIDTRPFERLAERGEPR